jgi:hypothetical protein
MRRRVRCRVGCFFVNKKDGMLRLVIDCRWSNRMCRTPPASRLAVPSSLARLNVSDSALAFADSQLEDWGGGMGEGGDDDLYGYSVDLTDGFYQFRCAAMASMFGLGLTVTWGEAKALFEELRGDTLYDDETEQDEPIDDSEMVEACFLGMSMGWSWSLYFCNECISSCMRAALTKHGLPPVLVGDRQQGPLLSRRGPVLAPYVDNVNLIAVGRQHGDALYEAVVSELRSRGLVLRDFVQGETVFDFLGLTLDGPRRVLRHSDKRLWRLWSALGFLLQSGHTTGDTLFTAFVFVELQQSSKKL